MSKREKDEKLKIGLFSKVLIRDKSLHRQYTCLILKGLLNLAYELNKVIARIYLFQVGLQ